MKIKETYDELLELAKNVGVTVRKENGRFKSGYAVVKEQKLIIINKNTTPEGAASVLAACLSEFPIDEQFVKPALREFIEKEQIARKKKAGEDFNLVVNY